MRCLMLIAASIGKLKTHYISLRRYAMSFQNINRKFYSVSTNGFSPARIPSLPMVS